MRKNRILTITIGITIFISILLISFSAFATNNSTSLKALNSMNKGYQAYQSHDFQKAIKHLKKCYQLIPYSKAAYYLSCCYYKLDDSNNARSYAVHALKDKPKLSRAYTDNVNTIIIWAKDIKDSSSNSVGSSIEMNGKADVWVTTLAPDPVETKFELSDYTCYKIRNRWKDDQYLHIEHGRIECSQISPGCWSAQWILDPPFK